MGATLRFTEEQLAEFEKRRRQWEREGKATVRTHVLAGEPEDKAAAARASKRTPKTSQLEALVEQQIALMKLPKPRREYKHIPGRDFRLDFAWPEKKIGLEVQGMVHRIKERFRKDVEKRALGLLSGWRILEVDGSAVRDGRAMVWIAELLA